MVVVTLPHEEVCGAECYCTAGQHLQGAHNPRTGDVGIRQVSLLVARSLHIPAGVTTEELPEAFVNAGQVKTLLNTKDLRKVA
jgi:hypothetical protein